MAERKETAPAKPPAKARRRKAPGTLLEARGLPSPLPPRRRRRKPPAAPEPAAGKKPPAPPEDSAAPPERSAPARKSGVDLEQVEKLAACGLSLEQIVAELGLKRPPGARMRVRMEAAIKRGRARGSAELKRAHYQAALNGSVTSLKEMLARLEEEEDEPDEDWIVEEVILHGPKGAEGEKPPEDPQD